MRVITWHVSALFVLSLIILAPAPASAERVVESAWGCNLEVGTPYVTSGATRRVHANAAATCRKETRFKVAVVRLLRARRGMKDEVVAVDRVPEYFYVRQPVDLLWPEAWGASVHVRTHCRQRWMVSDPGLYARAVFRKAGQPKRVVLRTPVWSGVGSETCRQG